MIQASETRYEVSDVSVKERLDSSILICNKYPANFTYLIPHGNKETSIIDTASSSASLLSQCCSIELGFFYFEAGRSNLSILANKSLSIQRNVHDPSGDQVLSQYQIRLGETVLSRRLKITNAASGWSWGTICLECKLVEEFIIDDKRSPS
jgi:hypothetical protein